MDQTPYTVKNARNPTPRPHLQHKLRKLPQLILGGRQRRLSSMSRNEGHLENVCSQRHLDYGSPHAAQLTFRRAVQRAPPASPPPLIALLAKSRISALQAELKLVKETIIPVMNQSIKTISADLADTREKITHFDTRFDAIEKPQGENLLKQSTHFDKLDHLIGILTTAIVPTTTPCHISIARHR